MTFTDALDNYLTAKREHHNLNNQRPQNRELILDAEATLARRRADLDGMFLAQDQVRSDAQPMVFSYAWEMDTSERNEVTTRVTSHQIDQVVADLVKNHRHEHALSEEDFADKVNLSPATIRRIENVDDGMTITMETARKLMPAIGLCACCGQTVSQPVEFGDEAGPSDAR